MSETVNTITIPQIINATTIPQIINTNTIPEITNIVTIPNTESILDNHDIYPNTFNNPNYVTFLVEYLPGIEEELLFNPNVDIYTLDEKYAVISVPNEDFRRVIENIKNISYVDIDGLYTPNAISPTESTKAYIFHTNPYLTLTGTGILMGIIDSGIDYLNQEFTKEDDTTRIIRIWDQTVSVQESTSNIIFGAEYTEKEINMAIQLSKEGKDPYSIVPQKDDTGHGTMVASVAGGRGKDRDLEGIAPNCTFAIVKLRPTTRTYSDLFFVKYTGDKYKNADIMLAIRYLNQLAIDLRMPIVICIPLGNNLGSHDGRSIIGRYINKVSDRRAIAVVTSTGNEGNTDTHTQGILTPTTPVQTIELNVAEGQDGIVMDLYVVRPNTIIMTIVSPSGESIGDINARVASSPNLMYEGLRLKFIYEGTIIYVKYSSPDVISGDEKIEIKADGLKPGIWQFRIQGVVSIDTRYDAWIPQKILLVGNTKFLRSVPYTTLQLPGTCEAIITTSYYNQNNDAAVAESGRGFTRDNVVRPIVTAPGINVTVATPGGGKRIVSGGSIAAAVVSGVCALLLEWGVVKGYDTSLHAINIQSYLIRGAIRRSGDIYPNPEWGFGIVSVEGIFDSIRQIKQLRGERYFEIGVKESHGRTLKEYYNNNIFIRNPYI